jgi:hypothetical protein
MASLVTVLSELVAAQKDGVLARYAIGGAVGATFYIEPAATEDIDVFVSSRSTRTSRQGVRP